MDERLLFLIGAPRSGTTLLARMLARHPLVHAPDELHLLTPLAHLGWHAHVDKAPYDPLRTALAARALADDLGEQAYVEALRAYPDAIYRALLHRSGKRLLLDKTPAYALVHRFVARLYPRARFVVLTRHPFAIAASHARSFFDGDWAAAWEIEPVVERYVPAVAELLGRDDLRRHHLRYEDLVTDPERALRRLCAATEIPFTPAMLRYGRAPVGDPVGVDRFDRPHRRSVDRWARDVTGHPDRRALLEAAVRRIPDQDLAAWGYTRDDLWAPLHQAPHEPPPPEPRFDRYRLQRRLLVRLRRNIHRNLAGAALRRARFYLDVLLRE